VGQCHVVIGLDSWRGDEHSPHSTLRSLSLRGIMLLKPHCYCRLRDNIRPIPIKDEVAHQILIVIVYETLPDAVHFNGRVVGIHRFMERSQPRNGISLEGRFTNLHSH
jgi:hypothetical protein